MRCRVRETRVEYDQLRSVCLAIDYPARMSIEVMTRFEVRADEQDNLRICVIRAGTIHTHPKLVALAASGRTDVCVRVMTVDTPGREDAFSETVFARAPDVIHDLVAAVFNDRFANACGDIVKRFIPADTFPFALAAFSDSLQRIENAIRVGYLIKSCGAFGAVAAARAGVFGIALKLLHFDSDFVDIGEQAAG